MKRVWRAALAARTVRRWGGDLFDAPGMARERQTLQHGETSVLDHSLGVALMSLRIARRLRLRVDERALVRGALLHDYFLYDWHEPGHGVLHGVHHPKTALLNARRDFPALSAVEEDVILKHMFPLRPTPPRYLESWLVCVSDKVCAVMETLRVPTMNGALREAMMGVRGMKSPEQVWAAAQRS